MSRIINTRPLIQKAKSLQNRANHVSSSQRSRTSMESYYSTVLPDTITTYNNIKDFAEYLDELFPYIGELSIFHPFHPAEPTTEDPGFTDTLRKVKLVSVNDGLPTYKLYIVAAYKFRNELYISIELLYKDNEYINIEPRYDRALNPINVSDYLAAGTVHFEMNDVYDILITKAEELDENTDRFEIYAVCSLNGTYQAARIKYLLFNLTNHVVSVDNVDFLLASDIQYRGSINDVSMFDNLISTIGVSNTGYLISEDLIPTDCFFVLQNSGSATNDYWYLDVVYFNTTLGKWVQNMGEYPKLESIEYIWRSDEMKTWKVNNPTTHEMVIKSCYYKYKLVIKPDLSTTVVSGQRICNIEFHLHRLTPAGAYSSDAMIDEIIDISTYVNVVVDDTDKLVKVYFNGDMILYGSLNPQSTQIVNMNYTTQKYSQDVIAYGTISISVINPVNGDFVFRVDPEYSYPIHYITKLTGQWNSICFFYDGMSYSSIADDKDAGDQSDLFKEDLGYAFLTSVKGNYVNIAVGYDSSKQLLVAECNKCEWKQLICEGEVIEHVEWSNTYKTLETYVVRTSTLWSDINTMKDVAENMLCDEILYVKSSVKNGDVMVYVVNEYENSEHTGDVVNKYITMIDADGLVIFNMQPITSISHTDKNKVNIETDYAFKNTGTQHYSFNFRYHTKYTRYIEDGKEYAEQTKAIKKLCAIGNKDGTICSILSEDNGKSWHIINYGDDLGRSIVSANINSYELLRSIELDQSLLINDSFGYLLVGSDKWNHLIIEAYNNLSNQWENPFNDLLNSGSVLDLKYDVDCTLENHNVVVRVDIIPTTNDSFITYKDIQISYSTGFFLNCDLMDIVWTGGFKLHKLPMTINAKTNDKSYSFSLDIEYTTIILTRPAASDEQEKYMYCIVDKQYSDETGLLAITINIYNKSDIVESNIGGEITITIDFTPFKKDYWYTNIKTEYVYANTQNVDIDETKEDGIIERYIPKDSDDIIGNRVSNVFWRSLFNCTITRGNSIIPGRQTFYWDANQTISPLSAEMNDSVLVFTFNKYVYKIECELILDPEMPSALRDTWGLETSLYNNAAHIELHCDSTIPVVVITEEPGFHEMSYYINCEYPVHGSSDVVKYINTVNMIFTLQKVDETETIPCSISYTSASYSVASVDVYTVIPRIEALDNTKIACKNNVMVLYDKNNVVDIPMTNNLFILEKVRESKLDD